MRSARRRSGRARSRRSWNGPTPRHRREALPCRPPLPRSPPRPPSRPPRWSQPPPPRWSLRPAGSRPAGRAAPALRKGAAKSPSVPGRRGREHFAAAVRLERADDARRLHRLEQAGGAVVADLEPALDVRNGGFALLDDDADGLVVERIL